MSDKRHGDLDPLDRIIRDAIHVTDSTGVQLRIDKLVGFELFNTRSYHNYETWSDGYRVMGTLDNRGWNPWPSFERYVVDTLGLDAKVARLLWRIATGTFSGLIAVEREDLDDAIATWIANRDRVRAILAESPALENQRTRLSVLGFHGADFETEPGS